MNEEQSLEDRWVCRRCFAPNGDGDDACRQCGLARGVVPTPAEQAIAMQTGIAPAAAPRPLWRRLVRFWWIPAIGLFLLVGYLGNVRRDDNGAITGSGTVSVADLAVGDCFDVGGGDEVSQVDAAPCSEAHQYELFHVATWRDGDGFPSQDAMDDFVVNECGPAFSAYLGAGTATAALDVIFFTPTEDGWEDGDRVFQCAVYDTTNAELTGSLRLGG